MTDGAMAVAPQGRAGAGDEPPIVVAASAGVLEIEMRRLAPHRYSGPYVRGQGAATRAQGEGAA